MICVLDVTAGPARGRRFWIRAQEKLEIGRISTADFSVPLDRHMSRHHLILEGHDTCFRLRDVGSANGTYVNDSKVSTIELCNGDRIKAGETVFEVSVIRDMENAPDQQASLGSATSTSNESAVAVAESPSKVRSSSFEVVEFERQSDGTRRSPNGSPSGELDFSHDEGSTSRRNDRDIISESQHRNPRSVNAPASSISNGQDAARPPSSNANHDSDASFQDEFGFEPSETPNLYVQRPEGADRFSLTHILEKIEPQFAMVAVIHRQHLRRFDLQLIETLADRDVVTQHGETTSILNDCSRDFHLLCESLLGQDAVFLLGSALGIDPKWIDKITKSASTPSELSQHIQSTSSELRKQLLAEFDFVVAEVPNSSQLQLLLRA